MSSSAGLHVPPNVVLMMKVIYLHYIIKPWTYTAVAAAAAATTSYCYYLVQ